MPSALPDPAHEPRLVQDSAAFEELLRALADEERIALDTEADSFFSYREKICLIQITAGGRDWLLDPLAKIDLAPFGEVLADPARLKVFHDGEYDVLLFKRAHGFGFANLFDTRVAASALGVVNPGLANVLQAEFGVELDKSQQRSDWGRRPLSPKQIAYARLDTHYLLQLMDVQRVELERRDRLQIVAGECRRLEALAAQELLFEPEEWVRLRGARELAPKNRRLLAELFALRDELARASNEPPFRVMQNDALVALAARDPRGTRDLAEVPGISWRQARKIGERVMATLARARELEPIKKLPQLERRDGTGELSLEEQELHERLKSWRKERAIAEGYDASLVLNRHALVRIAATRPRSRAELDRVEGLIPWQSARFGDDLVAVVARFEADLAAGRIDTTRRSRTHRSR